MPDDRPDARDAYRLATTDAACDREPTEAEGQEVLGQRKSIEPMAARLGVNAQSLQQLVSSSPWSDEALWRALRQEVNLPTWSPWRLGW